MHSPWEYIADIFTDHLALFFPHPKRGYWALECVLKLQQHSGSSKNRYHWHSAIAIYILHHAWEISRGHFDRLFGHVIVCYPTEAYYGYKMILAGFHSLNQRLFLVTLAPANPPREGRAKRVNGGIFDSEAGVLAPWGAKS